MFRWLTVDSNRVAGVFFPMAPSQDGERAERLTNTLFGAKDGYLCYYGVKGSEVV